MEILLFVGKALFSLLFISSGINHLKGAEAMAGYAASKGVPAAKLMVQLSGLLILFGGVTLLTGYWVDLGALAIAIFSLVSAVQMHAFWKESDAMAKMSETVNFFKNVALGGAALAIYALYHLGTAAAVGSLYGTIF
jgi:uncharacterized membrane protein YphA (DoxX/SURF4 family)